RLGRVAQQLGVLREQRGDVEALGRALARAGEAEEALDRAVEPLALLEDDLQELLLGIVRGEVRGEQLHRSRDRGARVADLGREPGREPAPRGRAVLEAELPLEPPPLREILEDQDAARGDARGVGERRHAEADRDLAAAAFELDLAALTLALLDRALGELDPE